jgi:hypothetical protein
VEKNGLAGIGLLHLWVFLVSAGVFSTPKIVLPGSVLPAAAAGWLLLKRIRQDSGSSDSMFVHCGSRSWCCRALLLWFDLSFPDSAGVSAFLKRFGASAFEKTNPFCEITFSAERTRGRLDRGGECSDFAICGFPDKTNPISAGLFLFCI